MKTSTSLWRNRDYLLLISGQIVSSTGSQVSLLAFPLLILSLTHSPALAGFAGALRTIPYIVFSLPAGALIDRWNRKRVMILCDMGRAICIGSIPLAFFLGHLTLVQLYLVSLIEGTLFVFFSIADVACLPQVVSKEQLSTATAQAVVINDVSFLLGPSLGGLLYSLGRFVPFLVDTLSYIASVVSLFFIKATFQGERTATAQRRLWSEISEGLVWLWRQPLIFFLAIIGVTIHIVMIGMPLIIIVIAQRQHVPSFLIGVILAMSGAGSVIGAAMGNAIQKRFRFARVMIGTTLAWTLLWPLYAIASNIIVLGLLLAATFMALSIQDVAQFSYRVALIPDAMQGRINSVFRLVAWSGDPIGLALTGVLLQTVGIVPTVLIYACVNAILLVATMLNSHLRNARPLAEVKAG